MEGKGNIAVLKLKSSQAISLLMLQTMEKESANKILQKFLNRDLPQKKEVGALGLSLSKRIIEQYHKGQLYVKSSEPNKGNYFQDCFKHINLIEGFY